MKVLFGTLIAAALVSSALAKECTEELFVKPGSLRGYIAVVNRQSLIPESTFAEAIGVLRENRRYDFRVSGDEAILGGAGLMLEIVDRPFDPAPMTVSPEVGRGILNVAALTNDLQSAAVVKKRLSKRAKLEFLRLVCYAFGVGGSRFDGNLLSASSIAELDEIEVFIPIDAFERIDKSAVRHGLGHEIAKEYREACQEGWAPAPTNDVQRKIWKEVHTPPSEPIRIKYDPKKGR